VIELGTSIAAVTLRELGPADAGAYYELLRANRAHLSQHGDFTAERDATPETVIGYFSGPPGSNICFGIWHDAALIGRVDLVPVSPPRYSIGYWLGSAYTGRGFATAACQAAIGYASDVLKATHVYAGIAHGNARSVALAERLGFSQVADFGTYTRFRLLLPRGS
jgi:RimJ/RimL family protein N-acetyltransferase